ALLLALDHALDELEDLRRARRLDVTGLERLAPVADLALLGELVEVRARDGQAHLGVGGDVARDLGPGDLHAEQLDVTAAAQLELDHELELLERGDLLLD